MPGKGHDEARERPITYCVIPRDLAALLHDTVRRYFREDPDVEVVVERRASERRAASRRSAGDSPPAERRAIRAVQGRRVSDRRAIAIAADPVLLPRPARRYADRLLYIERLEPTSQELEDVDTARLVARFQSGDREVFSILYMRYFDRVFGYLRVLLRDPTHVEDTTQQVFTQVLEALPRYERRDRPFRAWLFVIVRNLALEHLRKGQRVELVEPETASSLVDSAPLASHQETPSALAWVTDRELVLFIERLPLAQRQVLALRYMLGMGTEEIAQVLDRTPESVRTLNSRALAFLRTRLTAIGRRPERVGKPTPSLGYLKQARVLRARRFSLVHPGPTR
jgi:RNA polymerase sigma-70 factor (ECF subfamily)